MFFVQAVLFLILCMQGASANGKLLSSTLARCWFGFRFVAIWNSVGYIARRKLTCLPLQPETSVGRPIKPTLSVGIVSNFSDSFV